MAPTEGLLINLAGAVLDGTPVDWAGARSVADERERPLVDQLRLLSTLADIHRQPAQGEDTESYPATCDSADRRVDPLNSWGHLRVLARIGSGAFGDVYQAWDTRLDREVALKLLPADSSIADARGTSIIEEGRMLARVRHPNVVTIYGAERIEDRVGLWMEFVKGRTLEQAIQQGHTFSAAEAVDIGIQLCHALSAVHDAGLVHRDIKAQNVMVEDNGRVVLMDFGTGLELADGSDAGLAGTPLYLAPELFQGEAASVRSDIYSAGALLYHLLTGSYPVQAGGLRDLRLAHQRGERTSIRTARPDLPARLARIIDRAIDSVPKRRHENASALATDLEALRSRWRLAQPLTYALAASAALVLAVWFVWETRNTRVTDASASGVPAAATASAVNPFERPVIAVLPLKNLSDARDGDYFVEGLTDEIIRNLAVVQGLEVRSQTSSFAYRDKPRNLPEVGEQLGVNLVVEGSVLRSGNRLRVNAQLIRVADDVPLWSDRFDRELNDVFAIQDEISRAIVNRLRLTLGRGQRRYDTNVEAYDLFLKARSLVNRRDARVETQAMELFDRVIAKDPAFAPAYAGLVNSYAFMSMSPYGRIGIQPIGGPSRGASVYRISSEVARSEMRAHAVKALELDPLLAEAHAAMGWVHARDLEWANAERSFQRALELNPTLTQIHVDYSLSTLRPLAKQREAERLLKLAMTSDPLSLEVRRELANLQLETGQYAEAVANLQHALTRDPDFPAPNLARALTLAGRLPESIALLEKQGPGAQQYLAFAFVKAGRRAEAERLAAANREFPFREAIIYAALGDKDRSFEALERMAVNEPQRLGLTLMFPEIATLRDDPRYAALRKKLRLPS